MLRNINQQTTFEHKNMPLAQADHAQAAMNSVAVRSSLSIESQRGFSLVHCRTGIPFGVSSHDAGSWIADQARNDNWVI
jgi:hypothetical protein